MLHRRYTNRPIVSILSNGKWCAWSADELPDLVIAEGLKHTYVAVAVWWRDNIAGKTHDRTKFSLS